MGKNKDIKFTEQQLMAIDLLADRDKNGLDFQEIAKQVGVPANRITQWRGNQDFTKEILKKNSEYDENKFIFSETVLKALELLARSKRGYKEIAKELGISEVSLRKIRNKPEFTNALNQKNNEYRYVSKFTERQLKAIELLSEINIEGSIENIAKQLSVPRGTLVRWLREPEFKNEVFKKNTKLFNKYFNKEKQLSEKQLKAIELLAAGMTAKETAEQIGVHNTQVSKWKSELEFKDELNKKNPPSYFSKKQLKAIELLAQPMFIRLKINEIAKEVGIGNTTLNTWQKDPKFIEAVKEESLRYKDVPYNNKSFSKKQLKVIELLAERETSYSEIAKKLGMKFETIRNWERKPEFQKAIFDINPNYKSLIFQEKHLKAIEIISQNNSKEFQLGEFAKQVGVTTTRLNNWISKPRFREELIKERIKYGKDIDSMFLAVEFNRSDYYSLEEFKEVLSIPATNDKLSAEIQNAYNPKSIKPDGLRKYFKKRDIDLLKQRQDELLVKYIPYQEAVGLCESKGYYLGYPKIPKEPLDVLLRPFESAKYFVYLREDFNNWLENKSITEAFQVSMETEFETFKYRLDVKGIDMNKEEVIGPFTANTWLEFVGSKINNSNGTEESTNRKINNYISCTEHLIELVSLTNKNEIYSVNSNEINTVFNEIPNTHAKLIYGYLKTVTWKFKEMKVKSFDIQRVYNPYDYYGGPSTEKEIYDFDVYKNVYNYAKDISLHKERAIKDILEEVSMVESGWVKYTAASWLYVLLHLNNAWRHSDVVKFPRIKLSGTKISDLNWLLENEISNEDADYIIKQVYRAEIIISKTQVKNYFFCSEELKIPFATAIAMCELRTQALYPLRSEILDFGNKFQLFYENRRKDFFKYYGDEQFRFSSRKMNRTLMSYIYLVLSKINKGSAALKTVQRMRGHVESETTNIYIDIPEEEINFLSKQLFSRGSFGFIYDTFLDILQGIEVDREKRTTEIQLLNDYFGDVSKIENISGFLTVIQSERKPVLDLLLSKGLDKTLELLNKIDTNQLPSKRENVQCILGVNNCVHKGKRVDCFDCAFSVPNFYALSTLGESMKNRMNSFLEIGIPSTSTFYERRKSVRLLYRNLELFSQAFKRFGIDVYEFMPYSRDEFMGYLREMNSLEDEYQLKL